MNTQTTTIQTATPQQIIFAFCDICPTQASGTKDNLEANGWELYPTCQFCGECK